jgi:type VI protein secretion system component Hcp
MRGRTLIAVFALTVCLVAIYGATQQYEAFMTVAGVPGQIAIRMDRTDWTQVQGMPDPHASQRTEIDGIMGPRAANPLTSRGGSASDRDRGSALIEDIAVVKYIDNASHKLYEDMMSGKHIPEVRIEIVPSAQEQRTRFVIKLTGVVIKQIVEQPAIGRDRPTEAVTFSCKSLEWESRPAAATWRASPPPSTLTPRPP